ncbi:MAG: DUF3899 domain-containing protein [Clostridia bacterium]|nr:DUF3899 domain-containing protein [Clostridia bacterium]
MRWTLMQEENSNKKSWVKYLITAVFGLVVAFLICWLKGVFRMTEAKEIVRVVCDGFTFSGLMLTGLGLLTVLNKAGAFDGLGYSFKSMVRVFRNYRDDDKTPKTYYDYKKAAYEKRKRRWHLVIVGAGYLVVSIVLAVIHGTMA